ncbi:MAG: hypothetical protein HYX76_01710 [Acidobacteria bacterium]|nr:hypothetical protein [Acidobacteriota bacterium]
MTGIGDQGSGIVSRNSRLANRLGTRDPKPGTRDLGLGPQLGTRASGLGTRLGTRDSGLGTQLGTESGFTLIEMVVSVGIMVLVTGAIFQMLGSNTNTFRAQPEVADMQQRLRVAADMISKDLMDAGAGPERGIGAGPLSLYFPPIRPGRTGATSPDGELTASANRISIVYVPQTRAQAVVASDLAMTTSDIVLRTLDPGCPAGTPCGFANGMRAAIYDTSTVGAGYDLFSVTGSTATTLQHASPNVAFTKAYPKDFSRVVEVQHHVYYLDTENRRLMHYDGFQGDFPLVDNVVGLNFTYYADPDPNSVPKPPAGQANCVYEAGTPPVPLLANLGGSTPQPLTLAQLTDGPVCGSGVTRFDGDLLRIRKVRVTIGVQVGRDDLRGSDSTKFSQVGTMKTAALQVPDYKMSFEIAPRNLNFGR